MVEFKPILKTVLAYAVLIFFYYILQTAFFPRFKLGGVCPNVLVILVSTIGFAKGANQGMTVGIICGIILDIFSSGYFGMYALIFVIIGYLNGTFRQFFFGDDLKLPLLLIGSSDLIYGGLVYVFTYIGRGRLDFPFYFMNLMMPEAVYTILVSLLLYFPIIQLDEWLVKSEKRREKRLV